MPNAALTQMCYCLEAQDLCKILLLNKDHHQKIRKMEALWTISCYHSFLTKSGYTGFVN